MKPTKDGKLAAVIAHLTFLGPVIAWFINQEEKDPFGSFYIKQSFGIFCLFLLISAIFPIVPDSMFVPTLVGFYLFLFILWIYSFLGALSNEYKLLPVIGAFIQKVFTSKNKNK